MATLSADTSAMRPFIVSLLLSITAAAAAGGLLRSRINGNDKARAPDSQSAPQLPALTIEDGEPYIEAFRKCVAGYQPACRQTGHGADGKPLPHSAGVNASPGGDFFGEGAGASDPHGRRDPLRPQYRDRAKAPMAAPVQVDPAQVRIALTIARLDAACRLGEKGACDELVPEETRLLQAMEAKLGAGCKQKQAELCLHRGMLAAARGQRREAISFLTDTSTQSRRATARCSVGKNKKTAACRELAKTVEAAQSRKAALEDELRQGL